MTRGLIVSADDLGLHEAINTGVLAAHEEGIVTAASMVACGRAFDHACGLVRDRPRLDLGVHLTLIEEKPLLGPSKLKTLAPRGLLPATYRQLFWGLLRRRIDLDEVELELEAQINRVLQAGLQVSHLDSHQHAHFFPPLRPVLFRLAERHAIRGLRAAARVTPRGTKFSLLLAPLAKTLQGAARARGLRTPDTLWLPSPSGQVKAADLIQGLQGIPEGVSELVVHPGADQTALDREYPAWAFEWQQELAAVKGAEIREALDRHHIRLTRYSELD